jgi:RNA polymerase sigma-70 factor, ECF subfamily
VVSDVDEETSATAPDQGGFSALFASHQRELRVHCYRMLGSLEESEDAVQETFLRAWKGLAGFEGRSTLRAWLYRIATNVCLDGLNGRARRALPEHSSLPWEPPAGRQRNQPAPEAPWLQPFPDVLLGETRTAERAGLAVTEPDAVVVDRETIELAFLAAIQYLPPRQRAALILRDVVGWSAKQTAAVLDSSVPSVNSALQRARETLKERLPPRRDEWRASAETTEQERRVLRQYMEAVERADLGAVATLLAAEVRASMPPYPLWFDGRDSVLVSLAASWDPAGADYVGKIRALPTRANRQPAFATYVSQDNESAYRAFAISLLTIADGRIVAMTAFHDPALFAAFELPMELPHADR